MNTRRILFYISALLIIVSCRENPRNDLQSWLSGQPFVTYHKFRQWFDTLASMPDATEPGSPFQVFYDSLVAREKIPYIKDDTVAFLFRGAAQKVSWVGDFNGWNPTFPGFQGTPVASSKVWILEKTFPTDARLDYKIIADSNWILDPDNHHVQYSGWGPNSELRMPSWKFPEETVLSPGTARGTLSDHKKITSKPGNLGYTVQYRVYVPAGYETLSALPVVYVTDGHEYADDLRGAMVTVMDNLISQEKIRPVMAVFIDPRDPENPEKNRRMSEYTGNSRFTNFVADELVPVIDSYYRTDPSADARAILGTSLGGWNAAFFGVTRPDKFHLIAIHSPAFNEAVVNAYRNSAPLPLKVFMSTGVIFDTQDRARAMKTVLEGKGYPLKYVEVKEGHSWGNWRALIDEPLVFFFPPKDSQ
jgi:enterochelin esterase-like enzyme